MINQTHSKKIKRLGSSSAISVALLILPYSSFAAVTDIENMPEGIVLPSADIPLYINNKSGVRLYGGLTLEGYGAATKNGNFGSTYGFQRHKSPAWWEGAAIPALTGEVDLPQHKGTVFGGVSGAYALTRGDGDLSGSTPDHPEHAMLDDAYLGWKSGDLFASILGKDAISFSFGRQQFQFGDNFIMGGGTFTQGKYAAYYLNPAKEFQSSQILTLNSHGWHADLFRLGLRQYNIPAWDIGQWSEKINGINIDYTLGERANFGAAYMHVYNSSFPNMNGMKVYNIRAKGIPFPSLPGLSLGGQYVYERNHTSADFNSNAWYAQVTYKFLNSPMTPQFEYRHTRYDHDYQSLMYTYGGDWGAWYYGEIIGEFMLYNTNMNVDMFKATFQATDTLDWGLIGYNVRLDDPATSGAKSKAFAKEVDLYSDWMATKRLMMSGVIGAAFPDDGAKEIYGKKKTSGLIEVQVTYTL